MSTTALSTHPKQRKKMMSITKRLWNCGIRIVHHCGKFVSRFPNHANARSHNDGTK